HAGAPPRDAGRGRGDGRGPGDAHRRVRDQGEGQEVPRVPRAPFPEGTARPLAHHRRAEPTAPAPPRRGRVVTELLHTNPTEHLAAMQSNFPCSELTLAVNPLTWINELFRDWWLRGAPSFENAKETDKIGMWLWWFCVLWFVFLMALMIGFVTKYRRKKGVI